MDERSDDVLYPNGNGESSSTGVSRRTILAELVTAGAAATANCPNRGTGGSADGNNGLGRRGGDQGV